MGIVANKYKKTLVHRFDKEVGIPYYSFNDFPGLKQICFTFNNSRGIEIHYFFYYYENFKKDKIILFCPGIGPGHTAYLREIELLAKQGYKVLTLDYTGCGESKGELLGSLNMPTLDAVDLLNKLSSIEEIIVMGHSLGGYTALNLVHLRDEISKAVIMSGFVSVKKLMEEYLHSKLVANLINKYELKTVPEYAQIDNFEYLKNTKDRLLVIQSEDDTIVPYRAALKIVEDANNPMIKTIKVNGRKHNPNYTDEAVKYMTETFRQFGELIKTKKIKTDEDKINYFKNVSLEKLTEQDLKMFDEIFKFIEQ
jgi:dipeptidyl aminopeptidase/acylaminoacyl peptidase